MSHISKLVPTSDIRVYVILAYWYCPGEGTLTLTVNASPSGTEMIKTHHGCD